ncbi:LysR substrate-binding domain-containing protein [Enterococcus faecalis]
MDRSKLMTFYKLCELKKGNLVAKALGITPSTVSFHIQSLENEIGEQLFYRQGGLFFLTSLGEGVYEHAKNILQAHEALEYFLISHKHGTRGKIRVGFSEVSNHAMLPQFIYKFSQLYPNIKLSIVSDTSPIIEQLLAEFKLDYCILVGSPVNENLTCKKIGSDCLKVVCGSSHPFHQKKQLSKADILNQKMLFHEKQSSTRNIVEEWLDSPYEELNNIELDSISSMKRVLSYGETIAFMSDLLIKEEIQKNKLISFDIPISHVRVNRNIYLATNKNRKSTTMDKEFKNILTDCFVEF